MKKVYIIHGYTGHPDKNWFPWLKSELEKDGVDVNVLAMPNTDAPQYLEWLQHIQSQVVNPDENTYFVGHSLGCITILQYLNSLKDGIKIGGVVLVAGFSTPIHFTELNSFFDVPLDEDKIKNNAGKIVAINSDNDPHVPYWQAEELAKRFDLELVTIHNGQHLNAKAGYKEIPIVLEKLKMIFGLKVN
ncbi:MAG: serine hydrolase [Patescibacteria group bacterium]|nr:serine hydrolase [Patescibacteria group bacterium]